MGLENNLGVEIARHQPLIAHEGYVQAWGGYDPLWSAEYGYADLEDPTGNVLSGTPVVNNLTQDGATGLSGLVPWLGASYDIAYTGSDVRTNTSIQALSPELRSSLSVLLSVPLMRGLIWNEPWTAVKTTRVLEEAAWEGFRRDVMDTVQGIENLYWALIADEERVRVAEKSLDAASALLDQVETQYEVGVVSKVEIAEAKAGVAAREFELIVARNRYRNSMDSLIDVVLGPNFTADSQIQISPSDRPDEFIAYDIDVAEAARIALLSRPELAIAQKEIDRLEINEKFAKNQRLPQLDAVVSWGNRGLSGHQNSDFNPCRFVVDNPATPENELTDCIADPPSAEIGGFGKTFTTPGDFFTNDAAEQLTARGIFSIPLGNVSGRSRVSQAQLELRRAHVQRRREEQTIILEVRKAARDLLSSQEGIEAAKRRQEAAAEQLRAERIRLEYGESTPFDVLLRERDLVAAEQEYIFAFQTYRSSVTGLDRAQGTILRNRNVRIEDVARLR
jgi:outer membrane protein TolC